MPNNFQRIKDFREAIETNPKWPRVICFGDSWFQYPGAKTTDIEKVLPDLFKKTLFFNEGVAGRDSKMYKIGRDRVTAELGEFACTALLLSMGGNDIIGSELREFVKKASDPQNIGTRQWGIIPPLVRDHVRLSAFEAALHFLRDDFVEMIERRTVNSPQCEVVLHTYAYFWPNGKIYKWGPFKSGPWVHQYLSDVGVTDTDDQRVITNWLMDQFATLLQELASQYPRVRVIDSRKALPDEKSWDNEIHPNVAGFKSLVANYWQPALQGLLK